MSLRPKQMHVVKQLQSREIGASRHPITLHLPPFQQQCYDRRVDIWDACEHILETTQQTKYILCPLVEGFTHDERRLCFAFVVQNQSEKKFLSLLLYVYDNYLIIYKFHNPPPWEQNDIASSWFDKMGHCGVQASESIWSSNFFRLYLKWPTNGRRGDFFRFDSNSPRLWKNVNKTLTEYFSASLRALDQAMQ